jgi:hypothetical protein
MPSTARLVHFLLVEDDEDHANLILRNLRKSRVANDVTHVRDGEKALQYIRGEGDYVDRVMPDVILLDLKLPKVDGHEILRQIKEDPALKALIVVILTTSKNELDREKAYNAHANSYLVKPVEFDQFREMIDMLNLYWGVLNEPAV